MIIPTRINEKEDLALFFRLSRNPDFVQYRAWLTSNLDFLQSESMDRMDHEIDCVAKGACQFITEQLNATEKDNASKVYDNVQKNLK